MFRKAPTSPTALLTFPVPLRPNLTYIARVGETLRDLQRHISLALRNLGKAPGFTITAIITLALGIGANTAIFTLVHAVMMRSLPVAEPGQLYRLGTSDNCCVNGGLQDHWSVFSYELYQSFQKNVSGFEQL